MDRADYLANLGESVGMVDLGIVVDDLSETDADIIADTRPPATLNVDTSYDAFSLDLSDSNTIASRDVTPGMFSGIIFDGSVHAPTGLPEDAADDPVPITKDADGARTLNVTTDFDTHAGTYIWNGAAPGGITINDLRDEDAIAINVSDAPPGNIHMIYELLRHKRWKRRLHRICHKQLHSGLDSARHHRPESGRLR